MTLRGLVTSEDDQIRLLLTNVEEVTITQTKEKGRTSVSVENGNEVFSLLKDGKNLTYF